MKRPVGFLTDDRDFPFRLLQTPARNIKTLLQFAIGAALAFLLIYRTWLEFRPDSNLMSVGPIVAWIKEPILKLVGKALILSAGFELAFTLFTPGPDEAIDPLLLGLSATALITASEGPLTLCRAGLIGLLALTIGFLFFIRERFVYRG